MNIYEKVLADTLDRYSDRLKVGACNLQADEMMKIMDTLVQYDSTLRLSKEQACNFMNLSRSSFDDKVRCGLIPNGAKVSGFKELYWTKGDLEIAKLKICAINNGENLQ